MNYRQISYILFLFLAACLLSCENREIIEPDGVTEKYVMEDGGSGTDRWIYQFYLKTGTKILYDFNMDDMRWNMVNDYDLSDSVVFVQDQAALDTAIGFLRDEVLPHYSDEAMGGLFPRHFFLADSILDYDKEDSTEPPAILLARSGLGHLAIGYMGLSFRRASPFVLEQEIHIQLIVEHMYERGLLDPGSSFYNISGLENYRASLADPETGQQRGFEESGFFPTPYSFFPSQKDDITAYVRFIYSTPDEAVETSVIAGYPKMLQKYEYLAAFLKDRGIRLNNY